ncbi:MAG: hypothetical protein U0324_14455 [Polyangiales bacterium]
MRTRRTALRPLLLALAGAAAGFALTHPRPAEAVWHQRAASSCIQDSGSTSMGQGEITNDSLTTRMALRCPIVDGDGATSDDTLLKENVSRVDVYYDDHNNDAFNGSVVAKACVSYVAGGGACGSGDSSGTSSIGPGALNPPTNLIWTSGTADDFGYLYVELPQIKSDGPSTLRGYYITT